VYRLVSHPSGDQEGYEENFADATRELHDVFAAHGAQMFGYTDASSAAGYGHEASKTQLGDKVRANYNSRFFFAF